MRIFNEKSIKNKLLILAITICITFFFYRIVDFSINYDFVINHYHEFHHNQMLGNNLGMNHDLLIEHTFEPETQPNFSTDVSLMIDRFYSEDKGSLFYLLILLASFLMLHLIFIHLFFLYVRRWLIKSSIILERYTFFMIKYLHNKDGKKKCYPLYVHC